MWPSLQSSYIFNRAKFTRETEKLLLVCDHFFFLWVQGCYVLWGWYMTSAGTWVLRMYYGAEVLDTSASEHMISILLVLQVSVSCWQSSSTRMQRSKN